MRTRIKICGITNIDDALAAVEYGADALGFVFAESPRMVDVTVVSKIIIQLPPFIQTVGVFVEQSPHEAHEIAEYCGLSTIQIGLKKAELVKSMSKREVIPVIRIAGNGDLRQLEKLNFKTFLLDSFSPSRAGGTGKTFDWDIAVHAARFGNVILAGGLNPGNISQALMKTRPFAVDVSSGVEKEPGRKDHKKMQQFIDEVRQWDLENE